MRYCGIEHSPVQTKKQLERVVKELKAYFSHHLVGVYLHGSICLGHFVPGQSDLDLLIIISKRLSVPERQDLMRLFLSLHRSPNCLELSIIATEHLRPWRHPMPCQFHFSEYWSEKFRGFLETNDTSHWFFDTQTDFTDGDMACHITLTREKGIVLYGQPIPDVFPEVPLEDFWDSIVWDIGNADQAQGEQALLALLNACRVWSYKQEHRILSKLDAWQWAAPRVPSHLRYIFDESAASRYVDGVPRSFPEEDIQDLKEFVIGQIPR